jgi:hypothetical protein
MFNQNEVQIQFNSKSLSISLDRLGVCWMPLAHAYNPSYSGGRDQKDCTLRSAWINSSQGPISRIANTKRDGEVTEVEEHLHIKCRTLSSNPNC